jgi:hypothetical protein
MPKQSKRAQQLARAREAQRASRAAPPPNAPAALAGVAALPSAAEFAAVVVPAPPISSLGAALRGSVAAVQPKTLTEAQERDAAATKWGANSTLQSQVQAAEQRVAQGGSERATDTTPAPPPPLKHFHPPPPSLSASLCTSFSFHTSFSSSKHTPSGFSARGYSSHMTPPAPPP